MALDRMAACQSWICFPLLQCHVFMVYVLLCWGVFFSVLRLYSKWSIVWGLKKFFSSSLSSCKKLYFLNTLSPVLSTPLSYVCCVCMDRLMANFAGTCTSDNKGLLLLLLLQVVYCLQLYKFNSTRAVATSYAALRDVPLSEICAAATWASLCTFTRFYRLNVSPSFLISSAILSGDVWAYILVTWFYSSSTMYWPTLAV